MKTTATISQEELEQKAVDSMIAYEKSLISGQEMKDAVTRALHHYANREGHREIVLKGWIIKTIYGPRQQPTERPRPGSFHLHG